jgi:hypothetical protein
MANAQNPDTRHKVVGCSVPRIDAPDKATGKALYTADMKLPGMLYGKLLRSPVPHARFQSGLDRRRQGYHRRQRHARHQVRQLEAVSPDAG